MGSDTERIKERLDIAEVLGGYIKLEKAGANFKARCPFHSEKTPSFFISSARQNYYCFGCGAKGDIFTFVEEMEGLDFREALKSLAERAGVVLETRQRTDALTDKIQNAILDAADFFEKELAQNTEAKKYLKSRSISEESVKKWRIGYARDEWRALYAHLTALGHSEETLLKAGLIKRVDGNVRKSPYDVFRGRIIFPLSSQSGEVVAFSGRALAKDAVAKYLNSPDTVLFNKGELLYGLDKAKSEIRKKNYAVLVEGQIDLVLSHQSGVTNTVASSGTAFTQAHLEKLKKLSSRIILAFDSDTAGEKAALKSTELALALGMEVKIAELPKGKDPAEVISSDAGLWKKALKDSVPAVEFFLDKIIERESDARKRAKLVESVVLPLVSLVSSGMERSHFVSVVAKKVGMREEVVWEDLRRAPLKKSSDVSSGKHGQTFIKESGSVRKSHREIIEERMEEIKTWLKEFPKNSDESKALKEEEEELLAHMEAEDLRAEFANLQSELTRAESKKEQQEVVRLSKEVQQVLKKIRTLEDRMRKL